MKSVFKKSFLNKLLAGLTAGMLAVSMAVSTAAISAPMYAEAQEEVLTGMTANEIVSLMGKGFNFGNTLDATGGSMSNIEGHETSWGNPVINKDLMHGIKEAGFTTVRIPITWMRHINKAENYEISEAFKARVKEVVDLAYDEGLFVIVNVHHESWVNRSDIDTSYPEIGEELAAVWSQVADLFAAYDQHLIFEGMNEPRAEGTNYEWTGNDKCYEAIAYLDQVFVETIRSNGKGNNNERVLMIPGYAASSDPRVLRSIVIPEINGAQAQNIAISVHCYSPYNFCLSDNQSTFDPSRSADTADITNLMTNLKTIFLDKDIPVVIGECGCTNSGNNNDARLAWFTYFGNITAEYGIPAVVWDNGAGGSSGGECHKYFNRKTGEAVSQDLIDAFVGNGDSSVKDILIDFESVVKDGATTMIVPSEVGFTSSTIGTQFRINHTEGVKMGFSLKVDSHEEDFTALLNISKFADTPVQVTAWISSEAADQVSVGIKNKETVEMAKVDTTEEWTKVSFVVTPGAGKTYVYFKGNSSTFFVDDISVSTTIDETTVAEGSGDTISAGNSETIGTSSDSNTAADDAEKKGTSPLVIVMIVCGVAAAAAIVVLVASSKKNKK